MPDALAALDLFVMTSVSRSEGVPTAMLEAMAMGKIVVLTDVGAVSEVIESGKIGFVVAPEQPDQVAERITWALSHTAEVNSMASGNRQKAVAHFSPEQCASRHLEAYRAAISHARTRHAFGLRRSIGWLEGNEVKALRAGG